MSRIKALISDVDGTVVTTAKQVTERTRAAVAKLQARGLKYAIISGRPPEGMRVLIEPLGITTPIAGFNGGAIVRTDMSVIDERILSPASARKAYDFLIERGMSVWVFSEGKWLVRDLHGPHVDREERAVKVTPTLVADFDTALETAHKIVGVLDDLPAVAEAEADIQSVLAGAASGSRSQPYYLDVTHPDANKGAAVHILARLMGLTMDEVAVIGDSHNDLGMLAASPLSIAMGNAPDDVKAKARFVTGTNDAEGYADAIEKYLLGDSV